MMPVGVSRPRRHAVHALRVMLFAVIIALIHDRQARVSDQTFKPIEIELGHVAVFFPGATSIGNTRLGNGATPVLDAEDRPLGYVVQTSPTSDHVIGFSGRPMLCWRSTATFAFAASIFFPAVTRVST